MISFKIGGKILYQNINCAKGRQGPIQPLFRTIRFNIPFQLKKKKKTNKLCFKISGIFHPDHQRTYLLHFRLTPRELQEQHLPVRKRSLSCQCIIALKHSKQMIQTKITLPLTHQNQNKTKNDR